MTDNNRKLPLLKILDASVDYCVENVKSVSAFVVVNLLFYRDLIFDVCKYIKRKLSKRKKTS